MVTESDRLLPVSDFRRDRVMLSPSVFFWADGEPDDWPPHTDVIDRES